MSGPTSLAAVFQAPGRLALEERPRPRPGPGEALIEVGACAICGSDLHLFDGHMRRGRFPVVPGHEFMGRVIELGEGVNGIAPGVRACIENHISCGECAFCRSGRVNLCTAARTIGVNVDGAYSQHVVVPAKCVIPLPDGIDDASGAVMQTLGTGHHAVTARARLEAGETAVILGAGPVGLCALASARLAGARVIVFDTVKERIEAARRMGAEEALDAAAGDPLEAVHGLTGGAGADAVLEVVGGAQEETLRLAVRMLRPG
ncbi:MAG: alcohol dehydrogenase catalytic domain-containing protein, partial [bacterium]